MPNPVPMTIHQLFRQLTVVLEKSKPVEREQLKRAWLESLADFDKRTELIRFENWKRS